MIEKNIEAVIFDFGGIFIHLNYQLTIDAFEKLGINNFKELYSQAQQTNLFNDYETGAISSQRFINGLLDYLPNDITPNQVVSAWNAMLLEIPIEKIKLLENIQKKYPVYLLSNTNEIHIDVAFRRWIKTANKPIESYFNHVYLSHQVGLRKPDIEIFELVCKEQGLNPSTTLFIDDTQQHIDGAKKFGLQTILHTSNEPIYPIFS